MNLSGIKMVVTDMDGTLLNSKHEVSKHFFALFEELKKRNILFVAASGRQYNSIIEKLDPIKNDIIVVAENGSYAMQQEKELLSTPLSNNTVKRLLEIISSLENVHPVLCTKKGAYIKNDNPEFISLFKEYYSTFTLLENITDFSGEVLKIALYHFESSEEHIYPYVKHLDQDLKVKVSGLNWLDLSAPNAHKGYAIQKLQELYNIKPSETLVFGDYNNDLEMLEMAEYSFAMANAHPNVLKTANYVTKSNEEQGVEHILTQLIEDSKL